MKKYKTLCLDCLKEIAKCRFCDKRMKYKGQCDRCKVKFNYE